MYALLQKATYKDLWGYSEVQGYENSLGRDKDLDFMFIDYITASEKISLYSWPAQDNADSLCKKLKDKP